jgi:hypothetical protein
MQASIHPRLYINREAIARARKPPRLEALKLCADTVAKGADSFKGSPDFEWEIATHNAHLIRARRMQTRVVTLLTRWLQTGDAQYRDAAIAHVLQIGQWEYWSWITWRDGNADPMAIFDLSYGENSATIAIAYDLLHDELTDSQKNTIKTIAIERSFKPFLAHTKGGKHGKHAWWMYHRYSNWNTVCAGGAGMLALAMAGDVKESAAVLRRVEASIKPYMETLTAFNGAWPEGIGYWNYGMRYAFMYLLSHQNATGKRHPLMQIKGVKETLQFPIHFTPRGHGCSFGDVNNWSPLPFHYAAASDLNQTEVLAQLDHYLSQNIGSLCGSINTVWPNAAEMLFLHPGTIARKPKVRRNVLAFYKGQDWGIIADRNFGSALYATVRGGTTEVPHSHRDLTSYHLVVNDEHMIRSLGPIEYLDTTFSSRRWELPEMLPTTKNVMLINGVGIASPATVVTMPLESPQAIGFNLDSTAAMGTSRSHGVAASFAGRTILLLRGKAMLVVDRAILPHAARIESRFQTFARVETASEGVTLNGKTQNLAVAFACNMPATICTAVQAPTTPGTGANMVRWITQKLHKDIVMATLMIPGTQKPSVAITMEGSSVTLRCSGDGLPEAVVRLSRVLKLRGRSKP